MKRTFSEGIGRPVFPGVSSGSGVKRSHESFMSDDEEQLVTRARISALTAGLHGVNAAEDDEVSNGDAVTEEWLSSWYPETHMSQKVRAFQLKSIRGSRSFSDSGRDNQ